MVYLVLNTRWKQPQLNSEASLKHFFFPFPFPENDVNILPISQTRKNEAMLDSLYSHSLIRSTNILPPMYFSHLFSFFLTRFYNPYLGPQFVLHELMQQPLIFSPYIWPPLSIFVIPIKAGITWSHNSGPCLSLIPELFPL